MQTVARRQRAGSCFECCALAARVPVSARAPQVRAAGGLRVILASMQQNQRGENQLRGRAGRQGDPGETLALLDAQDRLIQEAGSMALVDKYILPVLPRAGAAPLTLWRAVLLALLDSAPRRSTGTWPKHLACMTRWACRLRRAIG